MYKHTLNYNAFSKNIQDYSTYFFHIQILDETMGMDTGEKNLYN